MPRIVSQSSAILTAVLAIGLSGCGGESSSNDAQAKADAIVEQAKVEAEKIKADANDAADEKAQERDVAEADVAEAESDGASSSGDKALPDMVGKGLQFAQDAAQAAGFYGLTSHDALGRGRQQVLDRNWKVCTQTPAPGATNTSVTVDYGAVKTEERCPSKDQGTTETKEAGETMPSLVGKSAAVAESTLPSASIDFKDGRDQGRVVLVASNWRVCSQSPKAGSSYGGVPVTLTVVKYGEGC